MQKLENKLAIVTGGAMGNGLGITEVFLKYGARVVLLDSSKELGKTLGKLESKFPDKTIIGYEVDIRDRKMLDAITLDISNKLGNIDILVNNAGICILEPFETMSDETRDKQFDINIKGTWNVTKAVLPYMKKGSIINLSSVTGPKVADPGECAYATTKAALIGFTKGLAADLVSKNIRVNAILPGYIRTPMVEKMAIQTNEKDPESVINQIAANIPMKRMGTIYELGELAAFLASDESSYITAETIVFDGGSTLPETNSMGVS